MYKIKIPSTTLTVSDEEDLDFLNSLVMDGSFWGYVKTLIENENEVHKAENVNTEGIDDIKSMISMLAGKLDKIDTVTSELKSSGVSVSTQQPNKVIDEPKPVVKRKKSVSKKAKVQLDSMDLDSIMGGMGLDDRFN